ncbi:hypothetical protein C0995_015466 [Termitomyces sp. Mi166|nr:hypothetical protein C0995_015466 [Termitomyces sp. Mi166\
MTISSTLPDPAIFSSFVIKGYHGHSSSYHLHKTRHETSGILYLPKPPFSVKRGVGISADIVTCFIFFRRAYLKHTAQYNEKSYRLTTYLSYVDFLHLPPKIQFLIRTLPRPFSAQLCRQFALWFLGHKTLVQPI